MSRSGLHLVRPERRSRRSVRLKGYDYASAGAYYVTICVRNRECLFGRMVDGKMVLSAAGMMIQAVWNDIPPHYPFGGCEGPHRRPGANNMKNGPDLIHDIVNPQCAGGDNNGR